MTTEISLDEALERAFERTNLPVRFIQIGGNDGVFHDPLYPHHVSGKLNFDWGHVYEPLPDYFSRLTENLRPFPYIECHRMAAGAQDGEYSSEFNYIPIAEIELLNLPPSSQGLGSFSRDRNALGGLGYSENKYNLIKDHIQTIRVDIRPMSEVLQAHAGANLVVTDCEGHDIELIDAALKSPHFDPIILYFEYLGHDRAQFQDIVTKLQARRYRISKTGKNVLCWRDGPDA